MNDIVSLPLKHVRYYSEWVTHHDTLQWLQLLLINNDENVIVRLL
ncbi:hypothetical protein [Providencia sp. PROV085]|nr:hypothetical protein [Providencia sp. PROV085]